MKKYIWFVFVVVVVAAAVAADVLVAELLLLVVREDPLKKVKEKEDGEIHFIFSDQLRRCAVLWDRKK